MRTPFIIGIIIFGLAVVGGAGYFGYRTIQVENAPTPAPPHTVPVQRGNVKLTVTAPGQLAGVRTETLRAPAATTLLEIDVRVGDRVKKNDVIARVDPKPLQVALEDAQNAAAKARDAIDEGAAGADEQVRKAEDNLSSLQLTYPSEARAKLELKQAQDARDDTSDANDKAATAYNNAKKTRDARKTDLNNANKALTSAQNAYNQAAAALAASQAAQALAQQGLSTAQAAQTAAQSAYDQAVADSQPQPVLDTLLASLQQANQAVADAQTTLSTANTQLQTDQQAADSAQASLQTAQTNQASAQAAYTAAETAFQSANLTYQQTQTALSNAEYSVKFAQLGLDNLKTTQQSADIQIEAAKRAIDQAKIDQAKAHAQTVDASLTDAVEKAQLALANATLHASFDGVVKEVNHQAGEEVGRDEPLATILDPDVLEVSSTVVEEDLPLVSIGQKADLFFDATPDAQITGVVDRIVPERAQGNDRTVYTVYIRIEGKLPAGLLPGMTVDGSIVIEQRENVLMLPRTLVKAGSNNTAIVEVWDGAQRQKRTIKIGLRGDVNVEILGGLQEGDMVVSE